MRCSSPSQVRMPSGVIRAIGQLTSAKTQQTQENIERCADEAERAGFYNTESRKGR